VRPVRPAQRVLLGAELNHNVHALHQIAAAVTEARRQFALNQYREYPSANSAASVLEKHPLAIEERFDTYITSSTDAQTEADRLQDLYSVKRRVYQVGVKTQPFQLELGDTVSVEYPRFGLTPAQNFVIIGLEERSASGFVTMTVWG